MTDSPSKPWDEKCVLGHCGSPAGCERDMQCRANLTAPLCDERSSEGSARDLYTAIMNLPCKPPFYGKYSAEYRAYRMGYHDARRAAAELALASPSPQLSSLSLEGERDKQRLDWLEAQGKDRQGRPMPWIARQSVIDRGFRLHNDWDAPHLTAREAIDAAMKPQS